MEVDSGAQLRQSALRIITDIKSCSETSRKRELVKELMDLDVERAPLSVEDILHEVVALQHQNETTDVKADLLQVLKKILNITMDWEVLCQTVDWLQGMLAAKEPPVVLNIIKACPKLTKNIFAQALEKGLDPSLSNGWQEAWTKNLGLLCATIDVALSSPDGAIKMYTAKLVEQCVLTLTNPSDTGLPGLEMHALIPNGHPVFNMGHLHSISQGLVLKLIGMCSSENNLRGTSQIALIKALGSIARLRAVFTGRIVPALLEMVASGKYHVASKSRSAASTDGVMVSISTALKEALLGALKNRDPTARVWRKRLMEGLKQLGAGQTAEQTMKQLERQASKEKRPLRPEKQDVSQSKRAKLNEPQIQEEEISGVVSEGLEKISVKEEDGLLGQQEGKSPEVAQYDPSARQHVPEEVRPSKANDDVGEKDDRNGVAVGRGPSSSSPSKEEQNPLLNKRLDVTQVRAILGLLASIGQKKLLQGFVKNLDVRILADVVIANLKDLTPRAEAVAPPVSPSSDERPGSPVAPAVNSEDARSEDEALAIPDLSTNHEGAEDVLEPKSDPGLQDSSSEASSNLLRAPSVESDDQVVVDNNEEKIDGEKENFEDDPGDESPSGPDVNGQGQDNQEDTEIREEVEVEEEEEEEVEEVVVGEEEGAEEGGIDIIGPDIRIGGIDTIEQEAGVKMEPAPDFDVVVGDGEEEMPASGLALEDTMDVDNKNDMVKEEEDEDEDEDEDEEEEEEEDEDEMDVRGDEMDGVQSLALQPRSLTLEQSELLMEQGISPLIRANIASNPHAGFSQGVLAKLAAIGGINKGPGEAVLNHVVESFPDKTAQELVVKWLYSIFLDHGAPTEGYADPASPEAILLNGDEPTGTSPGNAGGPAVGPYEEALSALLEQLSMKIEDPRDKSITTLLLDIPALPVWPVCRFLKALSARGSLFATLTLMTANKIMEERPPLRSVMLHLILELTTARDKDTREKAVRLVKNKLYSDTDFSANIEAFAVQSINKLRDARQDGADGEEDGEGAHPEEDWGRFCSLYMALCTRKKSLLRGLMEVCGDTNAQGQEAIYENAPKLADAIGCNSAELLELIRDTPEGADQLLLLMLTVMPNRVPSPSVVQACQNRFKVKDDVRFIVPALPGLPKREALAMVPLLARLPTQEFSAAILALIARPRHDESIEPSEVLVALNRANLNEQGVKLVQLRAALDHCLRRLTDLFDREALAGALNKMVQLPSLPILFMRMVLVSVVRERSLCAFVLATLLTSSVVIDKIMNEKNQWRGYLMLMSQTVPWSYKHLLELPTQVMKSVLKESSQDFVTKFRNFVGGSDCDIRIPAETMATLMESAEEAGDVEQVEIAVSGESSPPPAKGSAGSTAGGSAASNEESAVNHDGLQESGDVEC